MYSNTISLRYFFPRARILNEIAEFEKMPLNRKTLISGLKKETAKHFFCSFVHFKLIYEFQSLFTSLQGRHSPIDD